MNELIENKEEAEEKIRELQRAMMQLPQLQLSTEHYFCNGMYVRKLYIPKDSVVVGKKHKTEHYLICLQGESLEYTSSGMRKICQGNILIGPIGIKRIIVALSDSILINVHKTDKTDLEEIEKELIEFDMPSLFNADNKLKPLEIPGE